MFIRNDNDEVLMSVLNDLKDIKEYKEWCFDNKIKDSIDARITYANKILTNIKLINWLDDIHD